MLRTFLGIFEKIAQFATKKEGSRSVNRDCLFPTPTPPPPDAAQIKEDDNFEKCYPPLQVNFAIKERNGGKLSSHLWFFNAFANHLNPKYCFLLDVGTIARPRAICKLYQCFERDTQCAGGRTGPLCAACGEGLVLRFGGGCTACGGAEGPSAVVVAITTSRW